MAHGSKAQAQFRRSAAQPPAPQFMPVPPIQAKPSADSTELPDIDLDPRNYQIDLTNPLASMYGHATPAPAPIQAKLTVGAVGDKYEQEADRVAAQVVNTINSPTSSEPAQRETLQREATEEDELQMQPDTLQREVMEEDELQMQPIVQRVGTEGGAVSDEFENQLQGAKGSGQALDASLQAKMGQAMGADFSGVKVHTDAQSHQLNQSIQAKAFTTGQDVFFSQGTYNPTSQNGQELIAHELTHVVQQGGPQVQRKPPGKAKSSEQVSSAKKGKSKKLSFTKKVKNFFSGLLKGKGSNKKNKPINAPSEAVSNDQSDTYASVPADLVNNGSALNQGIAPVNYQNYSTQAPLQNEEQSDMYMTEAPLQNEGQSDMYITEATALLGGGGNGQYYTNVSSGNLRTGDNNREAPFKYSNLKTRDPRYAGEDQDSREITHVNDIFDDLETQAQAGTLNTTVEEALKKGFGWSDEDVQKYYTNRGKTQVKYLDEESREQYELKGGNPLTQQVTDPDTGEASQQPFDTSEMFSKHSGKKFGIYVMSPNGLLYSHAHKVGLFHHSSFLAGLPTAGAGEIMVINGIVKHITNKSGHYTPGDDQMIQTLQELKSRGVNLSSVALSLVGGSSVPNAQTWLDVRVGGGNSAPPIYANNSNADSQNSGGQYINGSDRSNQQNGNNGIYYKNGDDQYVSDSEQPSHKNGSNNVYYKNGGNNVYYKNGDENVYY